LANEDDERLPDSHGHTLQQHTNSITNKKDSGYGSQGHLKLEVRDKPSSIHELLPLDSNVRAKLTIMLKIKKFSKSFFSNIGNIK
jgi:hypothetical protein